MGNIHFCEDINVCSVQDNVIDRILKYTYNKYYNTTMKTQSGANCCDVLITYSYTDKDFWWTHYLGMDRRLEQCSVYTLVEYIFFIYILYHECVRVWEWVWWDYKFTLQQRFNHAALLGYTLTPTSQSTAWHSLRLWCNEVLGETGTPAHQRAASLDIHQFEFPANRSTDPSCPLHSPQTPWK